MARNLPRTIVLASSSRYRQEQLARLRLPFSAAVPDVNETALAGEAHAATAQRLALLKARACAPRHPDALIIGADQVAELDGTAIGKPGNHGAAHAQLRAMAGRSVRFHSGLALLDARTGLAQSGCVHTDVRFRALTDAAIEAYLIADQPYDCTGSAKIESLGICLVEAVHSDDPTALIGLPLILLTSLLSACGIALPLEPASAHGTPMAAP
jgi:septum formation protein